MADYFDLISGEFAYLPVCGPEEPGRNEECPGFPCLYEAHPENNADNAGDQKLCQKGGGQRRYQGKDRKCDIKQGSEKIEDGADNPRSQTHIPPYVARFFDLDAELADLYQALCADPSKTGH